MESYISENYSELSRRHYIRNARTQSYWFDFSASKVDKYRQRYGEEFCLVINGSDEVDDAYIMPYAEVKAFFDSRLVDDRGRWIGVVKGDVIKLHPGGRSMSASAYYNAFDLLDSEPARQRETEETFFAGEGPDLPSLRQKISKFNRRYREVAPHKRRAVSQQVARPNAITDYIKRLHCHTCQICGEQGFIKRNGNRYIEAHHITELHRLIPGSYCSDNIVVVCANCHRKLHYAKVSYGLEDDGQVVVAINGDRFRFERNIISQEQA